jgi:hypothetical protein
MDHIAILTQTQDGYDLPIVSTRTANKPIKVGEIEYSPTIFYGPHRWTKEQLKAIGYSRCQIFDSYDSSLKKQTGWDDAWNEEGLVRIAVLEDIPGAAEAKAEKEAAYTATQYIRQRKEAYRNTILSAKNYEDFGDYTDGVGFLLDAMIAEMVARGTPVTPEFTALVQAIAAVKQAIPKPE